MVAIYAVNRTLSTGVLVLAMQHEDPSVDTSSLLTYLARKADGAWYEQIATHGYPARLPVGPDGVVQENAWAFLPAYPVLVRGVMTIGIPWTIAAPVVSLVLGGLAMVLVHRLVARGAPRAVAASPGLPLATVAVLSAFPSAPVLQAGYAESLALVAVAWTLLALVQRQYVEAALAVALLGLTRTIAVPMVVAVVAHALVRRRNARAGQDTWDAATARRLVALGAWTLVAGLAWQGITALVTGVPNGYVRTQMAWREGRSVVPFGGWVTGSAGRPVLALALVLVAVAMALLLGSRSARRLGPELWGWAAGYPLFLAAVLEPHSSIVRFGLLAFPLVTAALGLVTGPRRTAWAWACWLVSTATQAVWVWWVWRTVLGDAFDPSP